MKFLVLWELDHPPMTPALVQAVLRMPDYAKDLLAKGKLDKRYHVVGRHGGAWIYEVDSNEELERLLAAAPVYNYARYDLYPLADMESPAQVLQPTP